MADRHVVRHGWMLRRRKTSQVAQDVFHTLDSSADAQTTFESLPADKQAAFIDYYLPVSEEVAVTVVPLDSSSAAALEAGTVSAEYSSTEEAQAAAATAKGCYGGYVKRTAYSALNIGLYDIYTEGSWCSSGTSVTSAAFSRSWSTIGVIGWRDAGQIGKGAGVVSGQARIWAQRKMVFGGWDVQTYQPCLRLNGCASGGKTQATICSIY